MLSLLDNMHVNKWANGGHSIMSIDIVEFVGIVIGCCTGTQGYHRRGWQYGDEG